MLGIIIGLFRVSECHSSIRWSILGKIEEKLAPGLFFLCVLARLRRAYDEVDLFSAELSMHGDGSL